MPPYEKSLNYLGVRTGGRQCTGGTALVWIASRGNFDRPTGVDDYPSFSVHRRCPERSFSESTGSPSKGHRMDTSGSLQSKVFSLSGL